MPMRGVSVARASLLAGCLALFVAAAARIPAELDLMAQTGRDPALVYLRVDADPLVFAPAPSVRAQRAQMAECDDLMVSVFAQLRRGAPADKVAAACLERAEAILQTSPSSSAAHLVRAGAFRTLGQPQDMVDSLLLSHRLARHEGWLAARRLRLAFATGEVSAQTALRQALGADVAVVLSSEAYLPQLVQMYRRNVDQRQWITDIVAAADQADQRRFLKGLRKAAAAVDGNAEAGS